ncbi:hypothetical protein AB0L26_19875 [Streptomyces nondiastaticus]|uniref:hypothetical protein n=1 Tax=Streptomyces TaxID=1883 RepID=UPI0026755BAD|nr:hypothetical protein [Streptomyces sp. VNUA116]WKU48869.1 hypothetical protein Q3V23_35080 [Streptomyces sp. VNUA116]
MSTPYTAPVPVIPRVGGAAVTGAVLATGAEQFMSWAEHRSAQACATTDGLCLTWWDFAALPLAFTTALIVLLLVYKRLGIRPRSVVILPTITLAPFPIVVADTTAGWWAVALTGGAWACFIAMAAWSRYRVVGVSVSVVLLLASLVILYR